MCRVESMISAVRRVFQGLLVAATLVLAVASPAFAHADLVSTNPVDGDILSSSPEAIELVFTAAVEPIGEGVLLVANDGGLIDATVAQPDGERIVLTPVAPLINGGYAVEWAVTSGDAHIITGGFTFGVDGSVPTEPPATGEDAAPLSPETTSGSADTSRTTTTTAATTEAVVSDQTPDTETVAAAPQFGASDSTAGEWTARLGRWAAMLGALIAIGAFAFSWWAFSGSKTEVRGIARWIRASGALLVVGAMLEAAGASAVLAATSGGGFSIDAMSEVLTGSYRWAIALRIAGGALLMWGVSSAASPIDSPDNSTGALPGSAESEPSGGGTDVLVSPVAVTSSYRLDGRGSAAGLAGVALVAASYLFDGHTVVATPNLIARTMDLIHVLSGGVWFGGLVIMSWLFTSRMMRGMPVVAAPIAVRFSRIAAAALLAVGIAGAILAATILDSPSELVSTPWGRLLIVKVVLVTVAALIGTYNHFRVVPSLPADGESEVSARRLARLMALEGAVLVVVLLVTATLVVSAS
jgi:copper transport protein